MRSKFAVHREGSGYTNPSSSQPMHSRESSHDQRPKGLPAANASRRSKSNRPIFQTAPTQKYRMRLGPRHRDLPDELQKIESQVRPQKNYPGTVVPRKTSEVKDMVAREASLLPTLHSRQVLMPRMLLQNRFHEAEKYDLICKIYANSARVRLFSVYEKRSNSGTFPPIVAEFAFPSLRAACIIRPDSSC